VIELLSLGQTRSNLMSIVLKNYVFPPVFVDHGREFIGQYGITKSGPIDETHFAYNHKLLNNCSGISSIECIGYIQIYILEPVVLAFTGSCTVYSAGHLLKNAVELFEEGTLVDIYPTQQGLRFYIGCYSGFKAEAVFNSNNAVNREGFGPKLALNDIVCANKKVDVTDQSVQTILAKGATKPHFLNILFSQEIFSTDPNTQKYFEQNQYRFEGEGKNITQIPFIQNFQFKSFTTAQRDSFLNEIFTVAPESNRMGYRLSKLEKLCHGIVLDNSQVTVLGGLQITPAGQTIVLMNDKQTVGGYPMMGTVTELGRARVGQLSAGNKIKFVAQDVQAAHAQQQMLRAWIGLYCDS